MNTATAHIEHPGFRYGRTFEDRHLPRRASIPKLVPALSRQNDFRTFALIFYHDELVRDIPWSQVPVRAWTATSVTPNCVFWSETSNEWRVDGVVLGGVSPAVDGTSTITCSTFHLSPFAIAEESSAPVEWASVTLLGDTDVLLKVGHPKRSAGRLTGVVWKIQHFPTALGLGLVVELSRILPDPTQPH